MTDPTGGRAGESRIPWVVGVSGASGTPYAASVLRGLLAAGLDVDLVISRAARLTLLDETGLGWRDSAWAPSLAAWLRIDDASFSLRPGPDQAGPGQAGPDRTGPNRTDPDQADPDQADSDQTDPLLDELVDDLRRRVRHWASGDLAAGPSSGSYRTLGMIVVPASTAAVAGIALGLSKDLLQRAASVALKERRRLIVVPREMPLSRATLAHMLDLNDAGAIVAVASPGFYGGATDARALVDFVGGKVLDAAGVEHDLFRRWTGDLGAARRG